MTCAGSGREKVSSSGSVSEFSSVSLSARGGGYLTGGSPSSSCEDLMRAALRIPASWRALQMAAFTFCLAERWSWSTFVLVRAMTRDVRLGGTKSGKCPN